MFSVGIIFFAKGLKKNSVHTCYLFRICSIIYKYIKLCKHKINKKQKSKPTLNKSVIHEKLFIKM